MQSKQNLQLLKLSPYIRYAARISGTSDNYSVPWRIIYDFEVIFIVNGELEVLTKDKKYILEAGDIHFMRPFVEHKRQISGGGCTYYNLHLDFYYDEDNENFQAEEVYCRPCELKLEKAERLENLAKRTVLGMDDIDLLEKFHIENPVPFIERFEALKQEYGRQSSVRAMRMQGIFIELLADLFEEMERENAALQQEEDVTAMFIRYTIEHYQQEIDIAALSHEYGFSLNYFRKVFKAATQLTPREYLLQYRIKQAKRLLALNKYTITEISYMVGYNDFNYFCKVFKKEVGCSPSHYAREKYADAGS